MDTTKHVSMDHEIRQGTCQKYNVLKVAQFLNFVADDSGWLDLDVPAICAILDAGYDLAVRRAMEEDGMTCNFSTRVSEDSV